MAKKYISDFTGGLNDITRPDLLADNELQKCINYEIDGTGNLVKRKESEIFDDNLDIKINEAFDLDNGGILISIAPPFFSAIKLKDQVSDYFIFVFGQNSEGANVLFGFYEKSTDEANPWTYQYIDDKGNEKDLLFSYKETRPTMAETFINFDAGSDRLIFTNGNDANGYFFVGPSQIPQSGTLGYGPPLNPPIIKPLKNLETNNRGAYSVDNFTTDSTVVNMGSPGYIQVAYTFVTESGFESNPSPISKVEDYYFNYRDTDNNNSLFLKEFEISNLSLPYNLGESFINEAKYFNVYARVFDTRKSLASKNFEFVQRVPIISKSSWGSNTDNTYTINQEISPGDTISYEQDISPVSEHVATTGGVTFLGNIKTSASFVGIDSQYHTPIQVTNNNPHTYIDAPIHIRIWDQAGTPPTGTGKIENLNWIPYFTSNRSGNTSDLRSDRKMNIKARENIRIIHSDMTTPMKASYKRGDLDSSGKRYVDLMFNVPQLMSGENTFYLCFNNIDKDNNTSPNAGVSYPIRVNSLQEVRDVLKYLTESSSKYEVLKSIEEQYLQDNVSDNMLNELQAELYSHPWVESHDQYEDYIYDVAPLYLYGQWVCGESPVEGVVVKDLAVQDYVWGGSTLLSCNGDTFINNQVFGDDEWGFINKAYMNYGGWKRADQYSNFGRYESGSDNFNNNQIGPSYYSGGRVVARDEAGGSFWSGLTNDADGPGNIVRIGQSVKMNTTKGNCAFSSLGFGTRQFDTDGEGGERAKFTIFFHLSYDEPQFDDVTGFKNKASTADQYDMGNNNGKGAFGKRWNFWRNVLGIRTYGGYDQWDDETEQIDGTFDPMMRFRFGMMLGKSTDSATSSYHPFLSSSRWNYDSYSFKYSGYWVDNSAPSDNIAEVQAMREDKPAFLTEDDASWLDTHKGLWTLHLSDGQEVSRNYGDWGNGYSDGFFNDREQFYNEDNPRAWRRIPHQTWWPMTNVICYTGKGNDQSGLTTDANSPMDQQCMPGTEDNRKYNYLLALSFEDGERQGATNEGANTSLFVCNTGATEPSGAIKNIVDGDGKMYSPSDWKEVKNIKLCLHNRIDEDDLGLSNVVDAEAFLKCILPKDGFNFGAGIGNTHFNRPTNESHNYSDNSRTNWRSGDECVENQAYSSMHIEYGMYLDPNEKDHQNGFNMMAYGFHWMPKPVGYSPAKRNLGQDAEHNVSVTYGKTFTTNTVLDNRTVRWSDIGALTFPDLNFKVVKEPILALISAPSFLKQEYQNCMLVFTRNMVYRFVLKDSPTGWAAVTDNLIEEYNQYGLYAPKSLVKAGNALFWLSEQGIVRYDSQGLRIINTNKVNVKLNKDAIGFYNPTKNQYILTYV